MVIKDTLLTVSNYNRPGTRRTRTTAIACHYIGNPGTTAQANRNYFESLSTEGPRLEKQGKSATKASCHYLIGLQGEILRLIPEDEISWCTNQANSYTISIEACHPDSTGRFNADTYSAYVELCADLCTRWHLNPESGLIRHYDVTGKICPKYFVDHQSTWAQFKKDVAEAMQKNITTGWLKDNTGWWYRHEDGSCPANSWEQIDSKWYWFDGAGYAVEHAWYEYKGNWYYLGADCAMATGLQVIDGSAYFFHEDGKMAAAGETILVRPTENGILSVAC